MFIFQSSKSAMKMCQKMAKKYEQLKIMMMIVRIWYAPTALMTLMIGKLNELSLVRTECKSFLL